jgi:type VI secretion system VasD/TssJ family lipoprotein
VLLCLGSASLLFACSSAPLVKQPPEWSYEKDAIALKFTADRQLNLFQQRAHSLLICLYQLRDPSAFNQLMDEKDGLAKLLDCNRFDPSVSHARRLVLQPNQNLTEQVDRAEGARFVGVVAGYYTLRKTGSIRTYTIAVKEHTEHATLQQKPEKLRIDLYLGPHEIRLPGDPPKTGQL